MDAPSLLAANLALIVMIFAILWGLAQITRDPSFVDAFWAFSITTLAVSSFLLGGGDPARKALLTGLASLWGARLGLHLFMRWRREGADRRYEALLTRTRETRGWSYARTTALFIFIPQALLAFVASLPVQLGQVAPEPGLGPLAALGAALAGFGIVWQAVADDQLTRFKADPANHGKVLDTGLWAWSRHPNYFGEIVIWWGLYAIAAETAPGLAAVLGPAFVTFTLYRWSGAPLLERGLKRSRPGYAAYITRTPAIIPRPPRRSSRDQAGLDG